MAPGCTFALWGDDDEAAAGISGPVCGRPCREGEDLCEEHRELVHARREAEREAGNRYVGSSRLLV